MASAESRITFLDGTKEETELDCHLLILLFDKQTNISSNVSDYCVEGRCAVCR